MIGQPCARLFISPAAQILFQPVLTLKGTPTLRNDSKAIGHLHMEFSLPFAQSYWHLVPRVALGHLIVTDWQCCKYL